MLQRLPCQSSNTLFAFMVYLIALSVIVMLNSLAIFGELYINFYLVILRCLQLHPQTAGQTKVVNRSLGDILCCSRQHQIGNWCYLRLNSLITIWSRDLRGVPLFHICTGYDAPTTLDLAPLPPMFSVSTFAIEFSNHINEVHDAVRKRLVYLCFR